MPGPWELILILLIVLVIFGAKRIPELMGGLGKGIRSFKQAVDEGEKNEPVDAQKTFTETTPKEGTAEPKLTDSAGQRPIEPK